MNLINLQEEYAKTEIAKLLNLLDQELVGLAQVFKMQGQHRIRINIR